MFTTTRKYFFIAAFALLSLAFMHSPVHATFSTYTVDAVGDGGLYPGQAPFATLTDTTTGIAYTPSVSCVAGFNGEASVQAYVNTLGIGTDNWFLTSAGNGYSGAAAGVSTPLLPAGTYQISAVSGAFTYDAFDWSNSPNYYRQWLWFLNIGSDIPISQGGGGTSHLYGDYTLGSKTLYGSPNAAYTANANGFIDITLANAGYLSFWIYDTNSIDNAGSLTFTVASVPLPSSLLLLLTGLPVLIPRVRHSILG